MRKYFGFFKRIVSTFLAEPRAAGSILRTMPAIARGFAFARDWDADPRRREAGLASTRAPVAEGNPLREYFEAHRTGRGIWKWEHYFDVYHRHFQKFVGREVRVLEIGIYSGGSLGMWRNYFGPGCVTHGVDIQVACKAYEEPGVSVWIGDQADRAFWRRFKEQVPPLDIVIDDGGHAPEQQIVTLEETLPHLRPGGVYLCEDVHGIHHEFAAYVGGLASHFHHTAITPGPLLAAPTTGFQRAVGSIHVWPFLVVIERSEHPAAQFAAPKHGTEWQPFL